MRHCVLQAWYLAATSPEGGEGKAGETMKKLLVGAASAVALIGGGTAAAETPDHFRLIVHDGEAVVPGPAECPSPNPAADHVNITFHQTVQETFTADTFHAISVTSGTFSTRDAQDNELASGRFVSRDVTQAPGFPILIVESSLKATGRATDGSLVNLRIAFHVTINANDEVATVFDTVSCG
jgi:hypothetical protein